MNKKEKKLVLACFGGCICVYLLLLIFGELVPRLLSSGNVFLAGIAISLMLSPVALFGAWIIHYYISKE